MSFTSLMFYKSLRSMLPPAGESVSLIKSIDKCEKAGKV